MKGVAEKPDRCTLPIASAALVMTADYISNASQGRLVLLKGLIKQGVSLDVVDHHNPYHTLLIAACANARAECVRIMLECPETKVG